MSSFKRSQAKYVKQTHKIANWPAYDQALVTRGSLTFWFTDEAISKWTAPRIDTGDSAPDNLLATCQGTRQGRVPQAPP